MLIKGIKTGILDFTIEYKNKTFFINLKNKKNQKTTLILDVEDFSLSELNSKIMDDLLPFWNILFLI